MKVFGGFPIPSGGFPQGLHITDSSSLKNTPSVLATTGGKKSFPGLNEAEAWKIERPFENI